VFCVDASNPQSILSGQTTWSDLSGSGNNGALTNGPTYVSSGVSSSIQFDGVDDYVNLGSSSTLKFTNSYFTINVWFKFNTTSNAQTIISNNETGGYGIISNFSNSGKIETFYYISGDYVRIGESLSNYNTSSWYCITTTYDGTSLKYYRNSQLIEEQLVTGFVSSTSYPLIIGANPGPAYVDFFNGQISNIQIYNRGLSSTEVQQNFNALRGRFGI